MKIFFIGDVIGQGGCNHLSDTLSTFCRKNAIDLVIANGENSAEGNGLLPFSANALLNSGVDVITTGNHCFKRHESLSLYDTSDVLIRPANYGEDAPGRGYTVLDYGSYSVAVINLQGLTYMPSLDNPFKCVEEILKNITAKIIIVDFHAEATSEKKAMGYFLAGRVSAVLGTHTHVQTADETILQGYTGYITDAGMTGVHNSILGVEKESIIKRFIDYCPSRNIYATGDVKTDGVILEVDKSGRCLSIMRV